MTPRSLEAFFEELWQNSGFEFWHATYSYMLFDDAANREAYNFRAKKTRARMTDPRKRDILAPLEPHPTLRHESPLVGTRLLRAVS
jgi:hypothetical protein